jgi:hypothetical protein
VEYQQRVYEVNAVLDKERGSVPAPPEGKPGLITRLRHLYTRRIRRIRPEIVCYYFRKKDFEAFGREAGLATAIKDIHALNPYVGYRFNVIYTKQAI